MKLRSIINILFFCFIYVTISETVFKYFSINIFSGSRHFMILIAFTLPIIYTNTKIKIDKVYFYIILIFLFFILGNFLSKYFDLLRFVYGFFLSFLFILIFILSKTIKITEKAYIILIKNILNFILYATIYAVIISIVINENLRFVKTIFREAGAFAALMNVGVIISLFLYFKKSNKKFLYIALFFTSCILITVLKKSILASVLTWFLFFFFYSNVAKIKYLIISITIPILIIFFLNIVNISNNLTQTSEYISDNGSSDEVRIAMYIASFRIANDFFPFGSGFGTFASVPSIYNGYSKVFDDYGISSLPTNSYKAVLEESHTILDTFWPHIIGELGYVGFFLFLTLYLYPIYKIRKISKNRNKLYLPYKFLINAAILTSILQGFFLYIPEIPSFIFINSGLVGLIFYFIKSDAIET